MTTGMLLGESHVMRRVTPRFRGGQGSSSNPSDDTYRGTGPFSEPESLAVSKFVTANGPFAAAIDYHRHAPSDIPIRG